MIRAILAVVLLIASSGQAFAYVGPGLGLGAIATVLGFIAAVLLAIVGVIWYPFKRLIRRFKAPQHPKRPDADDGVASKDAGKEPESPSGDI